MDIVDELYESDAANALTNRAAREIELLRAELELAQAQRNAGNRRIEQMTDELAAAQAQMTTTHRDMMKEVERSKELQVRLAEAQAREAKLREACEHVVSYWDECEYPPAHVADCDFAATVPHDDSALRERIAAELECVADEAPINGNDLAQTRVLIAADRIRRAKAEEISKPCS